MADALFSINDDAADDGYDASAAEVLTLKLKTTPVSGVQSVRFQVWDEADYDPDADVIGNPPRASKDAPELLIDNGVDAPATSVSPVSVDGEVTIELPNETGHSWIIRCVVNGGMSALADGRVIVDRTLIHERMVVIPTAEGRSPIVATETNQYDSLHGWAGRIGLGGPTGPAGPQGPTGATGPGGTSSAAKQIRREVYYADGSKETYDENNVLTDTTTSSTWTMQSDGNLFEVWVVPSGSSGGSGARNTINTNSGGTGAGGPCVRHEWLSRQAIAALSPVAIVVGAGVAGALGLAAARTVVIGNSGNIGNASAFGAIVAHPGGPGKGGTNNSANSGGSGGGSLGPGVVGTNGQAYGGAPNQLSSVTATNAAGIGTGGASASATGLGSGVGSAGFPSEYGGASGGGSTLGSGVSGRGGHGGNSLHGGPGAGGGGGADSTNRPGGGNGGGRGGRTDGSTAGNGVVGPALSAGQGNGTDGTDGTDGDVLTCTVGLPGSGGQQALITSGAVSFTSGRGGHGGFPGGSGGGSGAGICTGGTGNITIAPGGDSAAGCVVVVTYG